ncbi:MAG TPA: CapA family protein, partial [Pseudomonas sp.]|nr:CapA family protein [Pseudomonas sp.]
MHKRVPSPQQRPERITLPDSWRDADVEDGFCVVAVGDIIITHAIAAKLARRSPQLLDILKRGDVVVGNYECTAIDFNRYDGYPEALSGFSWLLSDADAPADLAGIGFNMMSRANNHALDWGAAGLKMTDALLDDAGIAHAGTGSSLA